MKLSGRRALPQIVLNIVFVIVCLVCIYPIFLVIGISFSDETSIALHGFNLIPKKVSVESYKYVFMNGITLGRAYIVTIAVTLMGTLLSTLCIALYAYPLSRPDFPHKRFFSRFVFFTMLFSGGLVPWYMVCVNLLHLRNNIFALFLPYTMNAWYVMIMRTFYKENVPQSIVESAKLDGAGEYTIFFRIIIHLAKPGIAVIALFNTITFWNDWWLPLTLVTDQKYWNLQFLMYRIQSNIQYLASMSSNAGGVAAQILQRLPSKTAQMATCVLVMGPIIMAYPLFQRYFVKGITVGSIKE